VPDRECNTPTLIVSAACAVALTTNNKKAKTRNLKLNNEKPYFDLK